MCLNLGGIANISFKTEDSILAYDICAANLILNNVAESMGLPYDDHGQNARAGELNQELLDELNRSW
jgi:anhydro-N-acetylmuramic acid kinase